MTDLPVSQRAREAAIRYFEANHTASAKWMREGAHHPLMDAFAAFERDCTAPLEAENARLRKALQAAYNWLEYENSPMGPAETKQYERLMKRIDAALQHGDSNDGEA